VLKSKVEFDLGRYQDAMTDADAAIRIDYTRADNLFNDGNVKPNQPATPCAWTQSDFEKLARSFPKDYRPPLYLGLYLVQFSRYSLDFDYQPVLKSFEHAEELNPLSPLPSYFSGAEYVVGRIGGLISKAGASCLDDVVPRTKECVALDDTRRTGVRLLTKAIAADPTFAPAYILRATALWRLKQNRQAIRDYNTVVELDPKANVYNDRALVKFDLHDYEGAILDYTKAIQRGCDTAFCYSFENRADAYLKLHDYPHAIDDIGHAIKNFLAGTVFGFNIEQFRRIYPEYDDMADDALCEKIRTLFKPDMSHDVYCKQFLVDAKEVEDFVLPDLFLKRGDAYADMGNTSRANREYDRVSNGYPKWAEHVFTFRNGKRVRVRDK
jgi:tetratricopeptide (TPR) repeat protein